MELCEQKQYKGGEKASRTCPNCHSKKYWKDGKRKTRNGSTQRFICRKCGFRFVETSILSINPYNSSGRQISVTLTEGTKNLTKVETRTKKAQREGTTNNTHIKETIINYAWQLKRNGYAESTIKSNSNLITVLIKRGADLNNPNSVKDVIAKQETWSKGRKNNAVKAYSIYAKQNNLTWEKPKYKPIEKPQFIPTEQELDSLIAAASKQMSTYLQVLKETGARRGEILHLTWDDIDFAQNAIRITPEKGSNPRIFKISIKLQTMLNILPKTNQQVFVYKNEFYLDKGFRRLRKKTAHKLGNPRLLKIHFHTIRHWKATIEYARTKDVLYVQKLLGHKDLKTTLRYIQFVEIPQEERFISKLANNAEEAVELVTLGFEYVTG